jgi:hypothetical protein
MDDIRRAQEIRAAIKEGDLEQLKALIGHDKAALEVMTVFGTWLYVAAAHGQLEIAKYLVSIDADINRKGGILGGGPVNEAASRVGRGGKAREKTCIRLPRGGHILVDGRRSSPCQRFLTH